MKAYKKRRHILAVARTMVNESGGQRLNMKDLATRADVPRATLYRYYSSKEHLITDLSVHWGLELVERLSKKPVAGKTIGNRMINVFRSILKEAADNPRLIRVALETMVSEDESARAMQEQLEALLPALLATAIDREQMAISKPVMDVLLRLLLANLQLLCAGRSTMKEACDSMAFTARCFLGDAQWNAPAL